MSEFQNRMGGAAQAGTDSTPLERVLSQLMGGHRDESGLQNLVERLRNGGLGAETDSWVSNDPNRPVDPDRLEQALGREEADRLALSAGVPRSGLMSVLSMFLPQLVNHLTPSGQLPRAGIGTPPGGASGGGPFGNLGGILGGGIGTPPGDRPSASGGGLGGLLGGLFGGLFGGGIGTPPADQRQPAPAPGGFQKGRSTGEYAPKSADPDDAGDRGAPYGKVPSGGGYAPKSGYRDDGGDMRAPHGKGAASGSTVSSRGDVEDERQGGGIGDILGGLFGRRDDAPDPRTRGGHTEEEIGGFWRDLTRRR